MTKQYQYNKKWRSLYPDKRNASRKKYYEKTQNAINSRLSYSKEEDTLILAHEIPDTELSKQIGRSVQGIQIRRSRLKGKKEGALSYED